MNTNNEPTGAPSAPPPRDDARKPPAGTPPLGPPFPYGAVPFGDSAPHQESDE